MRDGAKIYLVAGEASGDRLGAALMAGLSQLSPNVRFYGVGGPLMENQGLSSLFPMDELSIMGLVEVLPKLRHLFKRRDQTVADIKSVQPDALVTIDSPGFTLRVAKALYPHTKMPKIHYVAPSVWAWKPGRADKMAGYIDHVLALLPFEPPYMQRAGMSCTFVGHPIVAEPVASADDIATFRQKHTLENRPILSILPGSRLGEVTRLAPIFAKTAQRLRELHPDLAVVIPAARPALVAPLGAAFGHHAHIIAPSGNPTEFEAEKRACFAASNVALAASGTVSLELAAAGVPMVIGYQMNPITGWLMRRMALVDTVTLVNLLTNSRIVPEYLFGDCNPDNLTAALSKLLDDPHAAAAQRSAGQAAMLALGQGGEPPGLRAARAVLAQITP